MSQYQLGVTLGDPAGIGPEIVAATLAQSPLRPVIFGQRAALERAARTMGVVLPVLDYIEPPGVLVTPGAPSAASGALAVAQLAAAAEAASRGHIRGIVTAPLAKVWAAAAGFAFPGHTEFLGHHFGAEATMMFVGPSVRVALATVHVPLARVSAQLSVDRIAATIAAVHAALRTQFSVPTPRIGVLGLNPHAGENGRIGDEEAQVIAPAIAASAHLGARGPLVPDVAFRQRHEYDGLVAMYHDQALIAVKLLDFESAVNVTLGLPIVRTSPDHGTAFDIAGQGRARPASLQAALELADSMVRATPARAAPAGS